MRSQGGRLIRGMAVAAAVAMLASAMLGPSVRLAGGAAGDDLKFEAAEVGAGTQSRSDSVVVALIQSAKPLGIGVEHGHAPISGPLTVTKADGATVHEPRATEEVDFEKLHASIVNPAGLEPGLRDDVCHQCHMQPSVAIPGKRRFGRHDYSFRPGQSLSDYIVAVDIVEPFLGLLIGLAAECLTFDLKLHDLALEVVDFFRQGIYFDPQLRG